MRLRNLRSYLFLARQFRNGPRLIQAHRRSLPIGEAVDWSGRRLVHPPARGGLVGTLLEVWGEGCYDRLGTPRPGDVIVDAGAHVGLFSIRAALQRPDARIQAYEPFAENHACLLQNVSSFGLSHRIDISKAAVGGQRARVRLEAPTGRSIDHRALPVDPGEAGGVPSVTLDDLVEAAGGEIAFLKMDIEGSEHAAFANASREAIASIRRLALEYHDNLVPGTLQLLRSRLAPTHELEIFPTEARDYGLLIAQRHAD